MKDETTMTSEIIIHHDDFYKLSIVRNGHIGINVQLVSFMRKKYPNHKNEMEEHRTSHVEMFYELKVRNPDGVLNNNFKKDISDAVNACQKTLVKLQQNHQHIEGAMRDYAVQISK